MEEKDKESNFKKEAKSIGFILFIAFLIRVFIMEPFYIPSSSMKDTLVRGDYVFATKYDYGFSKYSMIFVNPDFIKGRIMSAQPERGDIIIMRPPHDMSTRYIKRLIGLPGDKVQIRNSILYINGVKVERKEIAEYKDEAGTYTKYIETLPNGVKYHVLQLKGEVGDERLRYANNTEEFVVPQGKYFFLGDNRDQSGDSRFQLGFVPFENFIAKARFFYFSTAQELWSGNLGFMSQIKQVYYWLASFRFSRFFRSVYAV
ncbi:MAG: signal peptidase I [Rickettsiaceae bacterium]|nr:signal peptidase I [Rickettsiaceae bacterium]